MRLTDELRGRVRLGVIQAANVSAGPASRALLGENDALCRALGERHAGRPPSTIEELRPARELYRSLGIDPTKIRPSSEALLRRVLRGDGLPRISGPVDLANALALRFLLPLGLYDADRIDGDVEARRGAPDERYVGIRKDDVHLAGRLVLVDRLGPFGNPTADSLRTSVGPATRRLVLVVFAPFSVPEERLADHVRVATEAIERHLAYPTERTVTTGFVLGLQ